MKVLCTADLHGNSQWFQWVIDHAAKFDLLVLPGDFVNGYDERPLPKILEEARWFFEELKNRGVPVLYCSGNHDDGFKRTSNPLVSWTDQFKIVGKCHGNGEVGSLTVKEEEIIYSCHQDNEFQKEALNRKLEEDFQKAHELQKEKGLRWLVVHHCPPEKCLVSKGDIGGNGLLRRLIEKHQPSYVFSGHLHQAPFAGDCVDSIGKTVCFNAGFRAKVENPNRLELDLGSRAGNWFDMGLLRKEIQYARKGE